MKKTALLGLGILLCWLCGCSPQSSTRVDMRLFVDSAGREVEIPVRIGKIAPSGPYAQIILYTLCPDKLIGLSDPFTKIQKRYIEEKYINLPIFGKLYGSMGTFNLEAILKAAPDIIIDMGEKKTGIGADLDTIQSQTGIPVIFIEATLETMADAYNTLGEMLGLTELSSEMSGYIRDVLAFAEDVRDGIPEAERPRVLYSQGEYGNEVNGKGSVRIPRFSTTWGFATPPTWTAY